MLKRQVLNYKHCQRSKEIYNIYYLKITIWSVTNTLEGSLPTFSYELKASMIVEKSNSWSKSLSMFNRDRLFSLSWVCVDLRTDLMRLRWLKERSPVQFVTWSRFDAFEVTKETLTGTVRHMESQLMTKKNVCSGRMHWNHSAASISASREVSSKYN